MSREAMKQAIREDYPTLHDYFIDILLDVYSSDKEWFSKECERLKKEEHKASKKGITLTRPPPMVFKEVVGAIAIADTMPETKSEVIVNEVGEEPNNVHSEQE